MDVNIHEQKLGLAKDSFDCSHQCDQLKVKFQAPNSSTEAVSSTEIRERICKSIDKLISAKHFKRKFLLS